ncbi:MAG: GNVR domain-containing protein [Bacteroidota bacterium]
MRDFVMVPRHEWEAYQSEQEGIDPMELGRYLWERRRNVVKIMLIPVLLGLMVAFLSGEEYQSQASLMPEYNTNSSGGSAGKLLQQYGGLLGMSGGTYSSNSNAIRVELYPQIMSSFPIQLQLLDQKIYFTEYDTTVTVRQFFEQVYEPSVLDWTLFYLTNAPTIVNQWWRSADSLGTIIEQPTPFDSEIVSLTPTEKVLVEQLQVRVTASLDTESGVVTVNSQMPDPYAAAAVGEAALALLKEYLKAYRTEKNRNDLEYTEEQVQKAEKRFHEAQNALANFRDENVGLTTAKSQVELERLQSEFDLAFNLYQSLSQQLQQVRLKLQEQTPLFKTLQPFQVPLERSSPRRGLILVLSVFLGLMLGGGYYGLQFYGQQRIESDSE